MRKKKKHNINAIDIKFFSFIIVSSIIVIAIVIGLIVGIAGSFNDHTYAITVTDKERITEQNGDDIDSKYLIYGTDKKGQDYVFENTDSLFRGKFNSSDLLRERTKEVWKSIKYGFTTKDKVKDCKDYTICLIKEALRLGSMCDKFLNYMS